MAVLPNPERTWARPPALAQIDVTELERRIGPVPGRVELLSGGLANLNVHVAGRGVLRIYRSNLGNPRKEARLLSLPWQRLRVPQVLREGPDFLLLEYVAHEPLQDGLAYGHAVGAALAEIHAQHFAEAGFLNAELSVAGAFGAELELLEQYAEQQLRSTGLDALLPPLRQQLAEARAALADLEHPCVLLHSDFKVSNLHWAHDARLLVLDWETAYAGPPLLDIGQLLRWQPAGPFVHGFAQAYAAHGGQLPRNWQRHAEVFDTINLAGLLGGAEPGSQRAQQIEARLRRTLSR